MPGSNHIWEVPTKGPPNKIPFLGRLGENIDFNVAPDNLQQMML